MKLIISSVFFVIIVIADCAGVFMSYINLAEVWHRGHGVITIFSCMAWLDDRQAMLYAGGWSLVFLAATAWLVVMQVKDKQKQAFIIALSIIALTVLAFYTDTLFYYDN